MRKTLTFILLLTLAVSCASDHVPTWEERIRDSTPARIADLANFMDESTEYEKAIFEVSGSFGLCMVDTVINHSFEIYGDDLEEFLNIEGEMAMSTTAASNASYVNLKLISTEADTSSLTLRLGDKYASVHAYSREVFFPCGRIMNTFRSGGKHLHP